MAKDKTTLRFWLRTDKLNKTDKPNKDKPAPVHLIYQVKGQRQYFAIPDVKLFPVNWDATNQQAVYKDKKAAKAFKSDIDLNTLLTAKEVDEINGKLQDVCNDISDIETRYRLDKVEFSSKMVIVALKAFKQPVTKKEKPGVNIVDFIDRFVNETTEHKEGTIKEYKGLANKMREYEKLKKVNFTFEGDAAILKGFSTFLTSVKEINNITKAKLFSTFKTILRHAKKLPTRSNQTLTISISA